MKRTWTKLTEDIITAALAEDIGTGDITTDSIVPPDLVSTAFLFNKAPGVLAGIDVLKKVFQTVDQSLEVKLFAKDGDIITQGFKIAEISGSVSSILKGERTALNFLGRMSGIATKTAKYVKAVEGYNVKILDTRKTNPTMRHLDKYSVVIGGGSNHRFGLFDMVLIKDNHIAVAGGIRIAVEMVQSKLIDNKDIKIEVECESFDQVLEAIYTGIDIIMLDNMDIPEIMKSVEAIRNNAPDGKHIMIEVSGNITLDNVRSVAETGIDYISVGALTHSVINHDFTILFNEI